MFSKHSFHYHLMALAYAGASALAISLGHVLEAAPALIVSLAYWHMATSNGE